MDTDLARDLPAFAVLHAMACARQVARDPDVWDADRDVAVLLGGRAPEVVPDRRTRRVRLRPLCVDGVSAASVRDALWTASELAGPST